MVKIFVIVLKMMQRYIFTFLSNLDLKLHRLNLYLMVLFNFCVILWIHYSFLGFLQTLLEMNEKIQHIQKSLESYLESKRRAFPRFYFISDDDLLSIIGQSSPTAIQQHLKKIFSGIDHLKIIEIVEEGKTVRKMFKKK